MYLKANQGTIIVIDRERKMSFLRSSKDQGSSLVNWSQPQEVRYSSTHSRSILSIYYLSGTIIDAEDMVVNKTDKILSP